MTKPTPPREHHLAVPVRTPSAATSPSGAWTPTAGSNFAPDYYEELQARLRALLIATGTWISTEQLSLLNELVDANEPGIALDMFSEALATSGARIDETLFRDTQSLAEQMKLKPEVVDRLRPLVE